MSDKQIEIAVSDQRGAEIFFKAYGEAEEAGSSEALCFAKGYLALEDAGYQEKDEAWMRPESLLDKMKEFFSRKDLTEKEAADFILKLQGAGDASGENFTLNGKILKMNEDQHLVYGWASIVEEGGEAVTDHHGDVIEPDELTKAAHQFVKDYRKAKVMHDGASIGEVVESIVFSHDIQKALGINLNKVGWFVGLKVHDDEVWKQFKSGELAMFSIGGYGERSEIQE